MNMHVFKKYWLPVVLWLGFIFLMSTTTFSAANTSSVIESILRFFRPSLTNREVITLHAIIRKLAHCVEYFISGLLFFRAFKNTYAQQTMRQWILFSFVAIIMVASSDEYHQSFLPSRTSSAIDVMIDAFGGILALCTNVLWERKRTAKMLADPN